MAKAKEGERGLCQERCLPKLKPERKALSSPSDPFKKKGKNTRKILWSAKKRKKKKRSEDDFVLEKRKETRIWLCGGIVIYPCAKDKGCMPLVLLEVGLVSVVEQERGRDP